jgi:Protein of unknown function (DUF3383)
MTTAALPVSEIIVINVSVAAQAIAPASFNQGLIVGPSTVIPSYGANARLRQYASLAAMVSDGFTTSSPEYIAAQLYFSANQPAQFVWIGRNDLTAIQTVIPHAGNAGTGYVAGDLITVVQSGASHGVLTVLTVSSGAVTSLGVTIGNQGTGYANAVGLATTGGTGTGLEVDITAIGETYLQSVEACQQVNQSWYGFMCCNAADADITALSAYSTANYLTLFYFGNTSDAAIINGTSGNIFLLQQALKSRCFLQYATTQGGVFPNNAYAAAAALGLACGLNTGLAGSAWTLAIKQLPGIAPEPLTATQYSNIINAGGNVCASFGPYTGYLMNGQCPSGNFVDQIFDRAIYVNLLQVNLMNLLISVPKVPQTDAGEHQLLAVCDQAAATMASIGWFGPGIWTGAPVLNNLATGQSLPNGYLNQAPPFATQSAGNHAARQAMPIYSAVIEAGAVQGVVVQVLTQI